MKLGKAFADSIVIEARSKRSKVPGGPSWWLGSGRALIFTTVFFVSFALLIWRLFDLTIIHGHEFRVLADENRTRELTRHAPRGEIVDRNGIPLVVNMPRFRLVKPCEKNVSSVRCVDSLSEDEAQTMTERGLPTGAYLEVDYARDYPLGNALSHLIGTTGEVTKEELDDQYYIIRNYRSGDRIGRTGVESVYEEKLRGRDGRELVEINAQGQSVRSLGRDTETIGDRITLSIDSVIAKAAQDAFPPGQKGAVIVSKPSTGEIIAIYSSPSFDPTAVSLGLSKDQYQALADSPDQPLFNRSIGGVYPPGSTFKIVTALAGLEEGVVKPDTTVLDTGVITIGNFSFSNWFFNQYGKTEGAVDIIKAIQRSNDIFFYKVGEWVGVTKLAAWAKKVGIGSPLGIELPGEAGGLMPDPAWKEKMFTSLQDQEQRRNQWYLGDTYHIAIGQGFLLVTPLQVNAWTNVIANGGKLCPPTLENQRSRFIRQNCHDLGIKSQTIHLITQGMQKACETGGTGWPLFNFSIKRQKTVDRSQETSDKSENHSGTKNLTPDTMTLDTFRIPVACKTGTAEFGDPNNRTHAWFTAFAPVPANYLSDQAQPQGLSTDNAITGDPEISVTVLVEGGGEGSNVAAPVAKKILESWFSR